MKLIILIAAFLTTNLFSEFIQFNSNIHSQVEKRVQAINAEINKIKNLPTIVAILKYVLSCLFVT